MSGGSMNYLHTRLEYEAVFEKTTPERKAFAKLITKVAKALHDIELVDSGDYAEGDENEAILACLSPVMTLESAIEDADEAATNLFHQVELARSGLARIKVMEG